jgi:hypothetical protein
MSRAPQPLDHCIAGTGGGIVAAAALYPLDVIRTLLQGVCVCVCVLAHLANAGRPWRRIAA